MKTENVRRDNWIRALRSGDFEQGTNGLRDVDDKMCCLGVACAVDPMVTWKPHPSPGIFGRKWQDAYFTHPGVSPHTDFTGNLPVAYAVDLGLTPEETGKLIDMNDSGRYSFVDIADMLEDGTIDAAYDDYEQAIKDAHDARNPEPAFA